MCDRSEDKDLNHQELAEVTGFSEAELGEDLSDMVANGIIEQSIGEDGKFYFSLTEKGIECAKLIEKANNIQTPEAEQQEEAGRIIDMFMEEE